MFVAKIRKAMADLFSIFTHALASGSKSTVLRPLGWLVLLTVGGAISASYYATPAWLIEMLGFGAGASIVIYLLAYIYFAIKSPDSLRTERYSIQKLAIQHGLVGDSSTGFFRMEGPKAIKELPESKSESEA
jgi:hypothetical protein